MDDFDRAAAILTGSSGRRRPRRRATTEDIGKGCQGAGKAMLGCGCAIMLLPIVVGLFLLLLAVLAGG